MRAPAEVRMPHEPDWLLFTEMISHIQAVEHCDEAKAVEYAVKALYDDKVQSRVHGCDPRDRIKSNRWADAIILKDKSILFKLPVPVFYPTGLKPSGFRVEVRREDVTRVWPIQDNGNSKSPSPVATVMTFTTGTPGRPTSKHLVEAEAKRRFDIDEVPETLADFASSLSDWLKKSHPQAAPMTKKAIENAFRNIWRSRPQK
jgi:hypothetical protein